MRVCEKCGFDHNRDTAQFCAQCGKTLGVHALLAEGTLLHGRYRIAGVLGKGGMGAVYLVQDEKLYGKQWAVKELLERFLDASDKAEAIAQFQHEARILVGLRHPNLPQIVDAFEEKGRHYLVMEYIEGRTLESMLREAPDGRLPEDQMLGWTAQICDVLNYLHSHEPPVIFRDLKPANIMITPRGQVKLIDFGVARLFDPSKGTDTLKMGTVGYAPPEQYAGQGQTTPRSDIYALGATLYQALTGDDPEAHPFVFQTVRRLNPKIRPQTARIITRSVQMDPDNRFPSAGAMKAALLAKGRRRWPLVVLASAVLLVALVALVLGGWWLLRNRPWEVVAAVATSTSTPTLIKEIASEPTPTPRPTSTLAPTATFTPLPSATSTPLPTPEPEPLTPTLPPPSPNPSPTPSGVALTSTSTLPPPLPSSGSIFYTIQVGDAYYLASVGPSSTQGEVIDPVSYGQSTCSGEPTASTVTGQTVGLYYDYRCFLSDLMVCPAPGGLDYEIVVWRQDNVWSLTVRRKSTGEQVEAYYQDTGLMRDSWVIWAPDGSYFYFMTQRNRELHRASPLLAGYTTLASQVYDPQLSPDGSMILYLRPVGGVGAYDVIVMNADGSNPRNVTNAAESHKMCPRWGR